MTFKLCVKIKTLDFKVVGVKKNSYNFKLMFKKIKFKYSLWLSIHSKVIDYPTTYVFWYINLKFYPEMIKKI